MQISHRNTFEGRQEEDDEGLECLRNLNSVRKLRPQFSQRNGDNDLLIFGLGMGSAFAKNDIEGLLLSSGSQFSEKVFSKQEPNFK